MNILYICHRIPYPPNKGDKIRSFNEIKHLSKRHNISLACLVDNKKDLIYVDELKKYCTTVDYDVINPKWRKIKSLMYLFSKKPLSVPYFYSKKLQKAIDCRALLMKFDAVFAYSSPMAEYVFKSKVFQLTSFPVNQFSSCSVKKQTGEQANGITGKQVNRQTKFIMDFVDVDSDKWRMYSEYSSFPKSLIYKTEWKRLMAYEKRVGETFDVSVFVSDAEVKLFKSFAPDVKAVSVPNGVDFEYFGNGRNVQNVRDVRTIRTSATTEQFEHFEQAKRSNNSNILTGEQVNILFTGAMDYFPNEDAVLYFHKSIWPLVKKELPHARFYIVGSNPSNKIKTISKRDSDVIVTGYVNDIRDYLSMANIFVAPLRIARGVQNKVLEAMASGLPVVATPQAVQGIGCNGGGFVFIEESAGRFAEKTIELAGMRLKDNIIIKRETFLKQKYNWDENMSFLEKTVLGG